MIEVRLDKPYYFPAQTIDGQIKVKISEMQIIKNLSVRLFKKQKIYLKSTNGKTPEVLLDEEKILRDITHILCENCTLKTGEHTFPFKIKLKLEEGGTGLAKGYFYDSFFSIENQFIIQATYNTVDSTETVDKRIPVVDRYEDKQITDFKIKTSTLLCFLSRSIVYRIQTDKPWYFKGDNVVIECFCLSKSVGPIISEITGNLGQIVTLKKDNTNIVKSRILLSTSAFPSNKNTYKFHFRIPMNLGPNISEADFSIRTVLFLNIKLFNGSSIKFKKYLNVCEPEFEFPKIDDNSLLKGMIFCDKILEY